MPGALRGALSDTACGRDAGVLLTSESLFPWLCALSVLQASARVCVVRAPVGDTWDAVRRGQPRVLCCGAVHRIVLYCIVLSTAASAQLHGRSARRSGGSSRADASHHALAPSTL